jgi:hypothetical protein
MMHTVTLTISEFSHAVHAANMRVVASASMKLNHATSCDRTILERFRQELVGACGEMAFGKLSGRWFIPSLNTFHVTADAFSDIEVRATDRVNGRLIVRDNDSDARRFVLALVEGDAVRFAGWMTGRDAKQDKWLDNPNGSRESWWVEQWHLNSMDSLLQDFRDEPCQSKP